MERAGKAQARFGHTAVRVSEDRLLVFGGAVENGAGAFATTNDTFLVDCATAAWHRLRNEGAVPCQRAAHAMAGVDAMEAMMFGGALVGGSITKEQLYKVRVEGAAAVWTEVTTTGARPGPRYGHSLVFAKPALVLLGGSTGTEALNDVWLLGVRQKAFAWTRLEPPGAGPSPRVYHFAQLCGFGGAAGMVIVYGGRDGENRTLGEVWGLRRHRNGTWDWAVPPPVADGEPAPPGRCQHTSLFFGTLMLQVGGKAAEGQCSARIAVYDYEYNRWYAAARGPECFRHVSWIHDGKLFVQGGLNNDNKIFNGGEAAVFPLAELCARGELAKKVGEYLGCAELLSASGLSSGGSRPPSPATPPPARREEIRVRLPGRAAAPAPGPGVADRFIDKLLRPKTYLHLAPDAPLDFAPALILELVAQAREVVSAQPIVVAVESPAKIFGDIHGQYADLMRFFDLWGAPCGPDEAADNYSYVFLGDYVDRGSHSLETICLLMALKVKFPDSVHLLRGNHEDRWINQTFGFFDECEARLGEAPDSPDSVFSAVNAFFEFLPLAALVDDRIFCVHGGIGSSLRSVKEIFELQRPLQVVHEVSTPLEKLVVDLLWSDPTDSDAQLGVHPNVVRDPHGSGNIVKFGPDVVRRFLDENRLALIVRAHECVMDGFERFAGGALITVFSATDYCGKHKNAGAILVVSKACVINAKLIYPSIQQANWIEMGEEAYRPPTPPRWHANPQSH